MSSPLVDCKPAIDEEMIESNAIGDQLQAPTEDEIQLKHGLDDDVNIDECQTVVVEAVADNVAFEIEMVSTEEVIGNEELVVSEEQIIEDENDNEIDTDEPIGENQDDFKSSTDSATYNEANLIVNFNKINCSNCESEATERFESETCAESKKIPPSGAEPASLADLVPKPTRQDQECDNASACFEKKCSLEETTAPYVCTNGGRSITIVSSPPPPPLPPPAPAAAAATAPAESGVAVLDQPTECSKKDEGRPDPSSSNVTFPSNDVVGNSNHSTQSTPTCLGINKKKYIGKFRILLNNEQNQNELNCCTQPAVQNQDSSNEPGAGSEDSCSVDSKSEKGCSEPFVPPTLLRQQSKGKSDDDNNTVSSEDKEPVVVKRSARSTRRRTTGRRRTNRSTNARRNREKASAASEVASPSTPQPLPPLSAATPLPLSSPTNSVNADPFDVPDDGNRRRSSRIKSLEEKKEQERAEKAKTNVGSGSGGGEQLQQMKGEDIEEEKEKLSENEKEGEKEKEKETCVGLAKEKPEKEKKSRSRKHKEEKEKNRKKRNRKKKCNSHIFEDESSEDGNKKEQKGSGSAGEQPDASSKSSLDCFAAPPPPSQLNALKSSTVNQACTGVKNPTSDSDESPKPEKVKSRWRRNSELESVHSSETASFINSSGSKSLESLSSSLTQSAQNSCPSPIVIPKETEPVPAYDNIDENLYLFERRKSKSKKEVRRMVCDCILTKEERSRGIVGCGDDCLNRMLMIECGSRCPLGDHCANKRFQKRAYAKVDPFRTSRKGWGLRALQQIQPGTFIMEYVGEVLAPREFKNRVEKYAKENREHHYFMALRSDEIIDATEKGNVTRFVNHSCEPNAETQKWTVNGELRIGFFAKALIQRGEEVTFDYQFQRYGKKAQECYCDSPNCRGFIGAAALPNIDIDGSLFMNKSKSKLDEILEKSIEKEDEEEFEDLALEDEIEKLTLSGGLRNRQQTLMLARLMVRAEDSLNRQKLLEVMKGTQEIAYLRLLLDYHGLQLLWSWMFELEDPWLKAEILEVLEILPIPNKTMLKDSKVLDIVERWSKANTEQQPSQQPPPLLQPQPPSLPLPPPPPPPQQQNLVNGSARNHVTPASAVEPVSLVDKDISEDSKVTAGGGEARSEESITNTDTTEESEGNRFESVQIKEENMEISETKSEQEQLEKQDLVSTKSDNEMDSVNDAKDLDPSRETSKEAVGESVSKEESASEPIAEECKPESEQEQDEQVKPVPNVAVIATKLLNAWKDLKEVFRIPRLERQKRHEDEKEADRRTKELEDRRAKGLPILYDRTKRGIDDRDCTIAGILGLKKKNLKRQAEDKKNFQNSSQIGTMNINTEAPGPTPPKVNKDQHRIQFEMELMRKQYEEAMKAYQKQMVQYHAMVQQQIQQGPQQPPQQPPQPQQPPGAQYGSAYEPSPQSMMHQSPMQQHPPPPRPPAIPPAIQQGHHIPTLTHQQASVAPPAPHMQAAGGPPSVQQPAPAPVPPPSSQQHYYPYESSHPYQTFPQRPPSVTSTPDYYQTPSCATGPISCEDYAESYPFHSEQPQPMEEYEYERRGTLLSPTSNLIECTDYNHVLMVDEKAVIQTDYGVELVPVKKESLPKNIFDPIYPAPGTYYLDPNQIVLFIPPPFDHSGEPIAPNVVEVSDFPYTASMMRTSVQTALPKHWRTCKDRHGNFYYFNKVTRKVQWNLPEPEIMLSVNADESRLPLESVIVSSADSTSTPKDESEIRQEETPSFLFPEAETNGSVSITPDATSNHTDCAGTPLSSLPGIQSFEPDPRKRKHMVNNHSINNVLCSIPANSDESVISSVPNNRYHAATESRMERRIKEKFKAEMSEWIKHCLNPYRKSDCRHGRILNNEDFKYLARKLTHFVMVKESKHCKCIEDLCCNETVKHKAKDYVRKYMAKQGPVYRTSEVTSEEKEEKQTVDPGLDLLLQHHQQQQQQSLDGL